MPWPALRLSRPPADRCSCQASFLTFREFGRRAIIRRGLRLEPTAVCAITRRPQLGWIDPDSLRDGGFAGAMGTAGRRSRHAGLEAGHAVDVREGEAGLVEQVPDLDRVLVRRPGTHPCALFEPIQGGRLLSEVKIHQRDKHRHF